jgi:HAMP domain-containing protein
VAPSRSKTPSACATIGFGFVLFAAIFGWRMAARISRPLVALKEAVVAVAQGDFNAKVHVASNDEIGVLCDAFNQMARRAGGRVMARKSFRSSEAPPVSASSAPQQPALPAPW